MEVVKGVSMDVANKLKILAVLFAQPGDLVLNDNEKAGLAGLFDDLVNDLTGPSIQ